VDALAGMFLAAFLAATVVPFYSELVFGALLLQGHDPWIVWSVATCGNTLGSCVNWILGRYLIRFRESRWFPFSPQAHERAEGWFQRFGQWSLLMAWAPIGGDALTFVAGLMRTRFWLFLLLVGTGKGARYAALLLMIEQVS
jgi:membrane protein YqaA with SNARE-associated domain